MTRIALALLLLALAGCVAPMPEGDYNGRMLMQQRAAEGPAPWMPRQVFE